MHIQHLSSAVYDKHGGRSLSLYARLHISAVFSVIPGLYSLAMQCWDFSAVKFQPCVQFFIPLQQHVMEREDDTRNNSVREMRISCTWRNQGNIWTAGAPIGIKYPVNFLSLRVLDPAVARTVYKKFTEYTSFRGGGTKTCSGLIPLAPNLEIKLSIWVHLPLAKHYCYVMFLYTVGIIMRTAHRILANYHCMKIFLLIWPYEERYRY